MTPLVKGLVVAALHVALTASLGAKLLIDRAMRPRVWVQVVPVDPDDPLRGRYVRLRVKDGDEQLAFFIPEHIPDPSIREPGEELWAEVTLPRKGPPRPIRLAVKKDGVLTPLR
ncbi:MAG TPA: GDYXXLXY domain-containing protein [Vicinamibacterales bacterium]|nr:GDYXXLXY domain-containing protein [Vicinamibacterales bacterium]